MEDEAHMKRALEELKQSLRADEEAFQKLSKAIEEKKLFVAILTGYLEGKATNSCGARGVEEGEEMRDGGAQREGRESEEDGAVSASTSALSSKNDPIEDGQNAEQVIAASNPELVVAPRDLMDYANAIDHLGPAYTIRDCAANNCFGYPQKVILLGVLKAYPKVWGGPNPPAEGFRPCRIDSGVDAEWHAITDKFNRRCFARDQTRYVTVILLKEVLTSVYHCEVAGMAKEMFGEPDDEDDDDIPDEESEENESGVEDMDRCSEI